MNNEREKKHIVDILFVLALFLVFTLSTLTLVLFGANIYQNTVNSMEKNYNGRTVCSYISGKLRSNDNIGGVQIGYIDGRASLILTKEINEESYSTYIYEYDGYLRELFVSDSVTLGADILSAGNKLCPVTDFVISEEGGDVSTDLDVGADSGDASISSGSGLSNSNNGISGVRLIRISVTLPDGDMESIYLGSRVG